MATIKPTTLPEILDAIAERLETIFEFPSERVLIDARDDSDDELHPQAEQYIVLRPQGQSPWTPTIEGAGRNYAPVIRRVRVVLWTRCATDEATQDRKFLTDASRGHFVAEHKLYQALLHFMPTDGDENALVCEPISPETATPPRKRKASKGWGRSAIEFNVNYVLDLGTSEFV